MMSRTLGDRSAIQAISTPEIRRALLPPSGGRLMIASDGLWDTMSGKQCAKLVHSKQVQQAAQLLVNTAHKKDSRDDITVMVVDLLPTDGPRLPWTNAKGQPLHDHELPEVHDPSFSWELSAVGEDYRDEPPRLHQIRKQRRERLAQAQLYEDNMKAAAAERVAERAARRRAESEEAERLRQAQLEPAEKSVDPIVEALQRNMMGANERASYGEGSTTASPAGSTDLGGHFSDGSVPSGAADFGAGFMGGSGMTFGSFGSGFLENSVSRIRANGMALVALVALVAHTLEALTFEATSTDPTSSSLLLRSPNVLSLSPSSSPTLSRSYLSRSTLSPLFRLQSPVNSTGGGSGSGGGFLGASPMMAGMPAQAGGQGFPPELGLGGGGSMGGVGGLTR